MLLEKMTFTALMWPLSAPLAPQRPNLTHRIKIKPNRGWQGRGTSHTMALNYSTQLRSSVCSTHIPPLHLEHKIFCFRKSGSKRTNRHFVFHTFGLIKKNECLRLRSKLNTLSSKANKKE